MQSISTALRRAGLTLAALLVLAILPSAANAASISIDGSGQLTYTAADGEKNYLSTYPGQTRAFAISDSGASSISYPAGLCEEGFVYYVVECSQPTGFVASLGDNDDIFNGNKDLPITADGGPGNDTLRAEVTGTRGERLSGGTGDDKITGGVGADVLDGGDGIDTIEGRDSSDQINAGPGDDKLVGDGTNIDAFADVLDGGPGFDTVDSDWQKNLDDKRSLNITLAGGADDGRAGENDDLRGVEHIVTNRNGTFTGSEGDDHIDVNQVEAASTIRGLGGNDNLESSDGDDTIDGGAGNDELDGGYGNDNITGGPGADRIFGDTQGGECAYFSCKEPAGNDVINAVDGEADQIDCGVGNDKAIVDGLDTVAGSCETVEKQGTPPVDPPPVDPSGEFSASFVKIGLAKALKSGVKVKVTGPAGSKVTLKAKKGSKVVATGSGKIGANGKGTVTLKFSKAGRKALNRARKVALTVAIKVTAPDGTVGTATGKLTLKR